MKCQLRVNKKMKSIIECIKNLPEPASLRKFLDRVEVYRGQKKDFEILTELWEEFLENTAEKEAVFIYKMSVGISRPCSICSERIKGGSAEIIHAFLESDKIHYKTKLSVSLYNLHLIEKHETVDEPFAYDLLLQEDIEKWEEDNPGYNRSDPRRGNEELSFEEFKQRIEEMPNNLL